MQKERSATTSKRAPRYVTPATVGEAREDRLKERYQVPPAISDGSRRVRWLQESAVHACSKTATGSLRQLSDQVQKVLLERTGGVRPISGLRRAGEKWCLDACAASANRRSAPRFSDWHVIRISTTLAHIDNPQPPTVRATAPPNELPQQSIEPPLPSRTSSNAASSTQKPASWRQRWTRSRKSRPRWLGPRRTRQRRSTWVRTSARAQARPTAWLTAPIGQLKAKLAKLKKELMTPSGGGGGGGGVGFDVARTGVASVGFIGFPSVGKSTLMSRLTGQHSEAAAYEFTTLTTVPGQVVYNGAKIQILDLPGIIQGAKDGKGRGRQVIAVAKTCHLIFIVLDVNKPLTDKRIIETELEGFGIRINKSPPNIVFKKKDTGGINITNTVPLNNIDHDEIKAVMKEYKITSADIAIRCDATIDDLIDVLEAKSRAYIPVIYALNKIDAITIEELDLLYRIPNACPISSEHGWNIDELLEQMWEKLNLRRVYTKPKGKLPDYTEPVVLRASACTVEDFCNQIHKSILEQFKHAIVYGKSVKHQPQRVGLSHQLEDEDILTIVKR